MTMPTLDTWTSLFLLAAGQGLFLSLLLWPNKQAASHRRWLSALIIAFSLLLVFNVSFWTRYNWYFPPINLFYPTLAYLIGPFVLFYLDGRADQPVFTAYRWAHFLPAVLVFILRLPAYWQPVPELQEIMETGIAAAAPLHQWGLSFMVQPLFIVAYLLAYAGVINWYTYRLRDRQKPGVGIPARLLAACFSTYTLAFVAYYILVRMAFFRVEHDYLISLIMALSIYAIGYLEWKGLRASSDILEKPKYQSSSLTDAAAASIAGKLDSYIQQHQPYQRNELRLNDLANAIDVSSHHLSQVINDHYGKTFNQFINEFRIREAMRLLRSEEHRQSFIIDIAYQVGFNNKTTFNHAFKAQTGMSPSKWRAYHGERPSAAR